MRRRHPADLARERLKREGRWQDDEAVSTPQLVKLPTARLAVTDLSSVKAKPVRWLWPNYFPLGKLVVIDGLPGQGKSTVAFDVAARGSTRAPMPDGMIGYGAPFSTLILSYEDDAADTLRPRLEAAGADVRAIGIIQGVSYDDNAESTMPVSLPKDIEAVDTELGNRPDVRLLIIDPITAAISSDVDMHRDQDVRRPLARLARMAAERQVCIVIVRHVRKGHGGNAIYAGGGSVGISGQARVVMIVEQHPEDPQSAVLAVAKSNVGPIPPSLTFRKVPASVPTDDQELVHTSRLEWTGVTNVSADELLQARGDGGPGERRDASEFLREMLLNGRAERSQVMSAARDAGISGRTVDRVARHLGVVKQSEGFGASKRAYWSLANIAQSRQGRSFSPMPAMTEIGGHAQGGGIGDGKDDAERVL